MLNAILQIYTPNDGTNLKGGWGAARHPPQAWLVLKAVLNTKGHEGNTKEHDRLWEGIPVSGDMSKIVAIDADLEHPIISKPSFVALRVSLVILRVERSPYA
jgi:hypothetical protein